MALLTARRLTAHYNKDLSTDIAKPIPYALLGIFLLDVNVFSPHIPFKIFSEIPFVATTLVYYFSFLVVIEIALKTITHLTKSKKSKSLKIN